MLTRWAAAAGLGLNLVLFLTASWTTTPYFLGPDIVFCFAWLPLVLAGAADQPAVDTLLLGRRTAAATGRTRRGAQVYAADRDPQTRGAFLSRGLAMAGAATLAIAGVATLRRGPVGSTRAASTLLTTPRHHKTAKKSATTETSGSTRSSTSSTPGLPSGAVKAGIVVTASGRLGRDLQGPFRRHAGHRRPPPERQPVGVQRRLHPRGLHGGFRVGSDRLPLPRLGVRPEHGRGAARAGHDAAAGQARDRAARLDLRRVNRGQSPVELRHECVKPNGRGQTPVHGWIFSPARSMATYFAIRRARVSGLRASWIRYRIA